MTNVRGVYMRSILFILLFTLSGSLSAQDITKLVKVDKNSGGFIYKKTNEHTGTAKRLYGLGVNVTDFGYSPTGLDTNQIRNLTASFIDSTKHLFGVKNLKYSITEMIKHEGWWHISTQQKFDEIPIYNSSLSFSIKSDGAIVLIGSNSHRKIWDTKPTRSVVKSQAAEVAKGFVSEASEVRTQQLIVYPDSTDTDTLNYKLAWKVEVSSEGSSQRFFINAQNGNVIAQSAIGLQADDPQDQPDDNAMYFSPTIYGTIKAEYYDEFKGVGSPKTGGVLTDSIALYETYNPSDTLDLAFGTYSGSYSIYYSLDPVKHSLDIPLANEYIRTQDQNSIKTHTSPGFYPNTPYEYNYTFTGEMANVQYHLTSMNEFINDGPYNYSGMNQLVIAREQDNKIWNTRIDETKDPYEIFYTEKQASEGAGWSSEIVVHEYGHAILLTIFNENLIDNGNKAEAMHEGFSDYFSYLKNGDANLYEHSDNLDNRSVDNTYSWDSGKDGHWNGQVIAGALYDFRQQVNNNDADFDFFKGLLGSPNSLSTFAEFGQNMVTVDYEHHDGKHAGEILNAFSNHNISVTRPPISFIDGLAPHTIGEHEKGQQHTWSIEVVDEYGPYDYIWKRKDDGYNSWYVVKDTYGTNSNTSSYTTTINNEFELKVKVVDHIGNNDPNDNYDQRKHEHIPVGVEIGYNKKEQIEGMREEQETPSEYQVKSVYPNPFNPTTTVKYALPKQSKVSVIAYDVTGTHIATMINNTRQDRGIHQVKFNGSALASGMYIIKITARQNTKIEFQDTKKVMLLK